MDVRAVRIDLSLLMFRTLLPLTMLVVVLASCARTNTPAVPSARETVIVSVAASAKDVVESLAEPFRSTAVVKVNSGPSNGLATQILAGAPSDLFLSASRQWADEVQKEGMAARSLKLLTNRLALVVPAGNPAQVGTPQDLLATSVKKIAMADTAVPAGQYGDQVLTRLELLETLTEQGKIVRGHDVRTALAYVERGEAEAGIVYSTDVRVAQDIELVYEFDAGMHDEIVYVLVLLRPGARKPAARAFYEFMQSPQADVIYSHAGFERIQ